MNSNHSDIKPYSFPVGDASSHVSAITFGHRSGKLLATGSEDNTIHIYLIGQMTSLLTSQCQSSVITALRFSNEENMLASGTRSGTIKICDLESQKVICSGVHKACIKSIEYFPSSNNFFATGSVDGTAKVMHDSFSITLWDPRRKGYIHNYKGHNGAINTLKFSPDGRYLVTASDDTAIRMWDLTAGKLIKAFQEHQGPVAAVEYHPRELLLASAGADRRIKFWDLADLQFVCETEMESSAIRCLAFEPTQANYILSGSNDTLRAHCWEPIQLLDTITMNWKNVLDMTIHKDQLFGASALQNKVLIGSIQLSVRVFKHFYFESSIQTKRRLSPVRDYLPNDHKAPTSSASQATTSTSRRSLYPSTAIKDEHVKVQPETAQFVSPEESKSTATTDSVMIDNQADYDRIFRANNRVRRSTERSPVSPPVPPTPAVPLAPLAPTTAQSQQAAAPASSSASVSQAHANEHPAPSSTSTTTPTETPKTNEQICTMLSKRHQTVTSTQNQRMKNLMLLINLSRNSPPQTSFQAIVVSHDPALECFLLRFVVEKLSKRDWNFDICFLILPAIRDLIKSHYHWYNLSATQALEKVLSNFGRMIYDNVGAKSIGVDLSQHARREKCQTCHGILHEIRIIIEEQLKENIDASLRQAYDDNLRLLNAYERS